MLGHDFAVTDASRDHHGNTLARATYTLFDFGNPGFAELARPGTRDDDALGTPCGKGNLCRVGLGIKIEDGHLREFRNAIQFKMR